MKGGVGKIILARFTCTSDTVTSAKIFATKTAGTYFANIGEKTITFSNGVSSPEYQQFTVTNVPTSVKKTTVTWQWKFKHGGSDQNITSTGPHTIYVVLASPQAPMTKPWTEVLDKACVWASGKSTSSSALEALTTKLYYDSGLDYDGTQSHYGYKSNPPRMVFDLTDFLSDWDVADCQDGAMYLSLLSSGIGASLTQTRRIQGGFYTKQIDPIGTPGWTTTLWNFHHIGWLSNVYDASIKLKPSNPRIPINENIDNPYKADLFSSGSWSPKNPFRLGQTDPYFDLPTEIQ